MISRTSRFVKIALLALAFVGCSTRRQADDQRLGEEILAMDPRFRAIAEGCVQVVEMAKAGDLPGFTAGDHGDLSTGDQPFATAPVTFPIEATCDVTKPTEPGVTYRYVMRKEAADANWRLIHAYKRSETGHDRGTFVPL